VRQTVRDQIVPARLALATVQARAIWFREPRDDSHEFLLLFVARLGQGAHAPHQMGEVGHRRLQGWVVLLATGTGVAEFGVDRLRQPRRRRSGCVQITQNPQTVEDGRGGCPPVELADQPHDPRAILQHQRPDPRRQPVSAQERFQALRGLSCRWKVRLLAQLRVHAQRLRCFLLHAAQGVQMADRQVVVAEA